MKKISLFLILFASLFGQEKKEWCQTQEALAQFKAGIKLARPILTDSIIIERENFRVHYTTIGGNATTRAYAESVAKYIEYSWKKQVDTLGWASPPPDNGLGGDTRYDIYIHNLPEGVMGRTTAENFYNNPYPNGATSFISIDNNEIPSFGYLRIVCAHEFNHACQFRYSYLEGSWWMENCATWMEDVCYDNENQYLDYLTWSIDPLDSPHKPINWDEDLYEYAGCLWPMFLSERYDISSPKRAWEEMGSVSGENTLSAINEVLQTYFSSNLLNALKEYAIWRYFTGSRADPTYHFSESNLWSTSSLLRTHSSYPASGDQGTRNPSGPGGTNYVQFTSGGTNYLRMTFDGEDNYLWSVYAIGYKTPPADTYGFNLGYPSNLGIKTVPFSGHSHIALVTTVTQWLSSANNLTFTYRCSLQTTVYSRDVGLSQILSPPARVRKDSSFLPKVRVENYGSTTVSFPVYFSIIKPPQETIYKESANVNNLPPDGFQEITFSSGAINNTGLYSVIAWTELSGEENPNNDRMEKSLEVYSPITDWQRVADVPTHPDGKRVKSGGCLAVVEDTLIFVLKGNNTPSLYRFNPRTSEIRFVGNLSYGGELLKMKKGAFFISGGDGYIYLARGGNTNYFYRAPKENPLNLTPLSQIPGSPLKGGTGMVSVKKGGEIYLYLLKGSKTRDFYAYNVTNGRWVVKPSALVYSNPDKGYPIGSACTFDGEQTIYALRAKYNELFKYDIIGDTWSRNFLKVLPLTHPQIDRKKYVKEGGALSFANNRLYAFKGGNSNEFWIYDFSQSSWLPGPLLPLGSENKGIKGGASLVSLNGDLFALKGNNTTGIWRYGGGEFLTENKGASPSEEIPVQLFFPEPIAKERKVYDIYGRSIPTRLYKEARLSPGLYFIEYLLNGKRKVKKVILIR